MRPRTRSSDKPRVSDPPPPPPQRPGHVFEPRPSDRVLLVPRRVLGSGTRVGPPAETSTVVQSVVPLSRLVPLGPLQTRGVAVGQVSLIKPVYRIVYYLLAVSDPVGLSSERTFPGQERVRGVRDGLGTTRPPTRSLSSSGNRKKKEKKL